AVSTVDQGVCFFSATGELLKQLRQANGLGGNGSQAMGADGQGGLWIESRSALQRISPELDCLTFDARHGLAGDVTTILLHDNRVYVGTTAGLYVSDPTADAPERLFRRLSPADPVNGLLMVDGELMFGGPRWSVIDAAGRLQVISQEVANGIVRSSRHPGVIYASNFDGVHWARRVDGEW